MPKESIESYNAYTFVNGRKFSVNINPIKSFKLPDGSLVEIENNDIYDERDLVRFIQIINSTKPDPQS